MSRSDLVLVLNAGSSSLKYQVVREPGGRSVLRGRVERVEHGGFAAAFEELTARLTDAGGDAGLTAVGHRVVHGGARHTRPERVDDAVLDSIQELSALAPLHNPPALDVLQRALAAWPALPHVAVFDTALFADLPPAAATPAIDRDLAGRVGIRRFGMHGTSHAWVAERSAAHLRRSVADFSVITLHLGNGASAAAIRDGHPVETSMGFTPLEGLVMGTRGGDLDPGILLHLLHQGWDAGRISDLLHHHSGLQGLAGTSDFRDLLGAVDDGVEEARDAYAVYCHRIRKYVGAYLAVLNGADAVVFTGGVGENVPRLRADALGGLDRLGIEVDARRNDEAGAGPTTISTDRSRVSVLVVPTDEERAIAGQVHALLRDAQA